MPVCDPGSLPGFVGTVTTVVRPRVTRRIGSLRSFSRSPTSSTRCLHRSPGARSVRKCYFLSLTG